MKQWFARVHRWFFPRITQYTIEPAALHTMQAMARQTHPKEAFGVLRGRHNGDTLVVRELSYQPFSNTTHSASVLIDSYAVTDLAGTFHSHPTPNAKPSAADLRLFAQHPGVHCISGFPYVSVHVYDHRGRLLDIHKL